MQYLKLRFRNAGLFPTRKYITKDGRFGSEKSQIIRTGLDCLNIKDNKTLTTCSVEDIDGCDTDYIIGVNQVSNLLHILMGLPACPSKKMTIFERNEEIFELAKNNAYIKYDTLFQQDELGNFVGAQSSTIRKCYENCSDPSVFTEITRKGIGTKLIPGKYTWDYVKRGMGLENFHILYQFLCEFFNDNRLLNNYTFAKVIEMFSENYSDERLINFRSKNKQMFNGNMPVEGLLFGIPFTGSNTAYTKPAMVTVNKGVINKITFDGSIIIKIDDNKFIEAIENNSGTARLLEGGFVYVESLSNFCNLDELETEYTKIG